MDIFFKNVKYHVEWFGNGKPIMMLHGFTGAGTSFQFYAAQVPHRTIIAPDIIGHGQSEAPENLSHYHIEEQAAMLAYLLEQKAISKIDVLGYSMGGRLAITFAQLYPEKVDRLILESTTAGIKLPADRELRMRNDKRIGQIIENDGIKSFVDYWENIPLFASQKKLSEQKQLHIRKQRLKNNPLGLINSLEGMGTGAQPSWWDQLGELAMPVLILTGSFDEKFCLIGEEMAKRMPQAEHKTIEKSGHTIHVEMPLQYVDEIERFLLETSTY